MNVTIRFPPSSAHANSQLNIMLVQALWQELFHKGVDGETYFILAGETWRYLQCFNVIS